MKFLLNLLTMLTLLGYHCSINIVQMGKLLIYFLITRTEFLKASPILCALNRISLQFQMVRYLIYINYSVIILRGHFRRSR